MFIERALGTVAHGWQVSYCDHLTVFNNDCGPG
jgi:hypothetical protein